MDTFTSQLPGIADSIARLIQKELLATTSLNRRDARNLAIKAAHKAAELLAAETPLQQSRPSPPQAPQPEAQKDGIR